MPILSLGQDSHFSVPPLLLLAALLVVLVVVAVVDGLSVAGLVVVVGLGFARAARRRGCHACVEQGQGEGQRQGHGCGESEAARTGGGVWVGHGVHDAGGGGGIASDGGLVYGRGK